MRTSDQGTDAGVAPDAVGAALCVLASGSRGNCSLLAWRVAARTHYALVDMGLSPRRTRLLLAQAGLGLHQIDLFLLTHLDSDHFHAGWRTALPGDAHVHVHRRHARRAAGAGLLAQRVRTFDEPFEAPGGMAVRPTLLRHDSDGVAAFRFDLRGCSIGFATDVGRVTMELVDHMRAVDVLAIESNYCPKLQLASARPDFLKQRIMGGSGHLSNEQSVRAVRAIGPRRHVVLLHLSQECNRAELAAREHAGAPYTLTVSSQHVPTRWVRVSPGENPAAPPPPLQPGLFEAHALPARARSIAG